MTPPETPLGHHYLTDFENKEEVLNPSVFFRCIKLSRQTSLLTVVQVTGTLLQILSLSQRATYN